MFLGRAAIQQTRAACHTLNKRLGVPHYPARTFSNIFYFFTELQNNSGGLLVTTNPKAASTRTFWPCCFQDVAIKEHGHFSHTVFSVLVFLNLCFEQKPALFFNILVFWISWITSCFGVRTSAMFCFPYALKAMKISVTRNSSMVST